jgi:hypothetical protein
MLAIGEPFYCPILYCDEGVAYRKSPEDWLPEISGKEDGWHDAFGDCHLVEFDCYRKVGDFELLVRRDGTFVWQGAEPPPGCTLYDSDNQEPWGDSAGEIARNIVEMDLLDGDEQVVSIEAFWSERNSPIYRARKRTISLGERVEVEAERDGIRVTQHTYPNEKAEWSLEPVAYTELGPLPQIAGGSA